MTPCDISTHVNLQLLLQLLPNLDNDATSCAFFSNFECYSNKNLAFLFSSCFFQILAHHIICLTFISKTELADLDYSLANVTLQELSFSI